MPSLHRSRARILFEVACAFGLSASFVGAWTQTYSTAMLPAAAIAALYALVHAFDMIRRSPKADESMAVVEPATANQGDLLNYLDSGVSDPVAVEEPRGSEPPAEAVAATNPKRKRKSPKQTRREEPVPEVVEIVREPEPEVAEAAADVEPEVAELESTLHVVETASDEPEYVPATPLFEPEPFVRHQRAAFGRKAR